MVEAIYIGMLGCVVFIVAISFFRFEKIIKKYRYRPVEPIDDLPTVSVCIPARNEVHAMTECLERVIASDYPKLEVIVLDDSSVDDTSILIKSFAHAGVRFVEGRSLPEGWLGKNNALQSLLEEASGEYVLFLDVDTTIETTSVTQLVSWSVTNSQQLVSVLPQRADGLRASVFLGTLRYFWMLFLSSKRRPPVSGASWLVRRKRLLEVNGFVSFKAETQPEDAIARVLVSDSHAKLLISNSQLGISYEKKWTSQVESSIRLLKPLFGSVLRSIIVATLLTIVVALPISGLVIAYLNASLLVCLLSLSSLFITTIISLRYFKLSWKYGWWLGAIHWPYILLQEATLVVVSIIMYARQAVTWKGRPIRLQLTKH